MNILYKNDSSISTSLINTNFNAVWYFVTIVFAAASSQQFLPPIRIIILGLILSRLRYDIQDILIFYYFRRQSLKKSRISSNNYGVVTVMMVKCAKALSKSRYLILPTWVQIPPKTSIFLTNCLLFPLDTTRVLQEY